MNGGNTTRKVANPDWARFDAMTSEERHAAALRDSDVQPLTAEREQQMRRAPQVFVFRRALKLSRKSSRKNSRYYWARCEIGNRGVRNLTPPQRAYLKVIASNPTAVVHALQPA